MLGAVALILGFIAFTQISALALQFKGLADTYEARNRQAEVVKLAEALEQYRLENHASPASLTVLTGTSGFEYTRSLMNNWQGYAVSGAISDGAFYFQRQVLTSNDPSKGVSAASYMAQNACGSGDFATATSWCGHKSGLWYRNETREGMTEAITEQRLRSQWLLHRFADYFSKYKAFPNKDSANNTLASNSIATLASIVGYAGGAKTCTGTFNFQGVPVDCADMFDVWGGPVGYQYISKSHIILVSESPIYSASGNRIVVASDSDYSLM